MEHMEKRIELERRGRPVEEIKELNLDNCRSTQLVGLTDEFKALQYLSLTNVGLTTLKGFPNLPALTKLELSDNRISTGLQYLQGCPNLTYLNLSGNKIKDIESLEPLRELKSLQNLDLFNCEVTNLECYRDRVFDILSNLKYLDGYDQNDVEQEDDAEDDDDGENGNGELSDEDSDDDEVNGEDDDDDDDDDEVDEVGLSYLQKSGLEDDSEGDDFEPGDDDEDDEDYDDEDDDADEAEESRGVKRKSRDDDDDDAE